MDLLINHHHPSATNGLTEWPMMHVMLLRQVGVIECGIDPEDQRAALEACGVQWTVSQSGRGRREGGTQHAAAAMLLTV